MKLLSILLEQEKILVPRRTKDRAERYLRALQGKIQEYIKNGSKGSLNLQDTPITSLPDNLKYVGGNLSLSNTPIKSLPDNLEVEGDLYLDSTSITSLPDNLEVEGDIYVHKSPLAEKYTDEEIKNLADIGGKIVR